MNPYEERIENCKKIVELYDILESHGLKLNAAFDNYIIIEVGTLDELHKARRTLRSVYADWNDSVFAIGVSGNIAYAHFGGNHDEVKIWFASTISDFPESLKSPGCDFKKQEIPAKPARTSYAYVCNSEK